MTSSNKYVRKNNFVYEVKVKSNFGHRVINDPLFSKVKLTPTEYFVLCCCLDVTEQKDFLHHIYDVELDAIVVEAIKRFEEYYKGKQQAPMSFLKRSAINRTLSTIILKLAVVGGWVLIRDSVPGRGNKAKFFWHC